MNLVILGRTLAALGVIRAAIGCGTFSGPELARPHLACRVTNFCVLAPLAWLGSVQSLTNIRADAVGAAQFTR